MIDDNVVMLGATCSVTAKMTAQAELRELQKVNRIFGEQAIVDLYFYLLTRELGWAAGKHLAAVMNPQCLRTTGQSTDWID